MEKVIKFNNEPVNLRFFLYNDLRVGILMTHNETGQLLGNATLNMPSSIPNTEIIVKSYGDVNVGLYEALLEYDIINPVRRMTEVGYNKAHVCKLNERIYSHMMKHVKKQ